MRKLIVPSLLALSLMAFAAAAQAGGAFCAGKKSAAGQSCHVSKTASLPEGLKVETFRLPSGGLAVFYTSDKPEVVKTMQERAAGGAENFCCGICREMAQVKDCKVELASFSGGVVALVTANEPKTLDAFEKQFAALTTAQTPATP